MPSHYAIKSKIWLEVDGQPLLGEGRARLLRAVDETGSLSAAARSLGMSYKRAWSLVNSVNSKASKPVVVSNTGGKAGGGTQLTDYGRKLLAAFDRIKKGCRDYLDHQSKQTAF